MVTVSAPLPVTVPPVMLNVRIGFDNEPMSSVPPETKHIAGGQAAGERQPSCLNDCVARIGWTVHGGRARGAFRQAGRTGKDRVDGAALNVVRDVAGERAAAQNGSAGEIETCRSIWKALRCSTCLR